MLTKRRIRRGVVAAVATVTALLLGLAPAAPAAAQECGFEFGSTADGDEVLVWTCGANWHGGGGDGGQACETMLEGNLIEVPCVDDVLGWFSTVYGGCYVKPANPQPPVGDPAWEGHSPEDGLVYAAACFGFGGVDGQPFVYLPTNLFLASTDGLVVDLLEEAIAKLPLRGPDIQLAPDPGGAGLVGLPVWMWTPATRETWGPAEDSATALGITLRVAANGEQIRWEMGDGGAEVCDAPGEPYRPEYGADDSDFGCTYKYQQPSRSQPGGRYPITATTEWRIDWWIEGTVIRGVETRTRESTASVRINELQVVTS